MIYQRPDSVEISLEDYIRRYGSEEKARQRLYNIGAGSWSHSCWTNLDLPAQTEAYAKIQAPCIHHDLVSESALPIATGTADAVYCSHVVEHLPDAVVLTFMRDVFRCLHQGGVFRVTTGPCADLDWEALMREDEAWWYWFKNMDVTNAADTELPQMTIYDYWLYSVATPKSQYSPSKCHKKLGSEEIKNLVKTHIGNRDGLLNQLTHALQFNYDSPGDHISWWNFEKLRKFLMEAGFTEIYRSAFGQSTLVLMRDLRHFDRTYPQISVYVEARR